MAYLDRPRSHAPCGARFQPCTSITFGRVVPPYEQSIASSCPSVGGSQQHVAHSCSPVPKCAIFTGGQLFLCLNQSGSCDFTLQSPARCSEAQRGCVETVVDQTQAGAYPRHTLCSNVGMSFLMQRRCSSFAHLLHVRHERLVTSLMPFVSYRCLVTLNHNLKWACGGVCLPRGVVANTGCISESTRSARAVCSH